jgi:LytS/YehU family sensor histidine kinase
VAFAYVVIYFTLPRYFFNRRNRLTATIMFAAILMMVLFAQYCSGWLVAFNWSHAGPGRKMPAPGAIISQNLNIILLNYPVVVGFAVIIKMMKRSWLKQQETLQVSREKAKAELQLLKSQIHPHFLFNTLNNVYYLTLTASQKAPEMLEKLSDMLRYILNECNRPYVSLEKEIKMVEDYMALEKIRYGERLKMDLEIKGNYKQKMISPLLLIPLVENSFKHGASKMLLQPWVDLRITIEGQHLLFLLSNSRPEEATLVQHNGHIGLNNVKKRLQLLYPNAHELSITRGADSYEVFMKIHLSHAGAFIEEIGVTRESLSYDIA